jgi:hypothetical protein
MHALGYNGRLSENWAVKTQQVKQQFVKGIDQLMHRDQVNSIVRASHCSQ